MARARACHECGRPAWLCSHPTDVRLRRRKMKTVKIVGGPAPVDVKITLEPEGIDITTHVLGLELVPSRTQLLRVRLEFFAQLDLTAEVDVRPGDQEQL